MIGLDLDFHSFCFPQKWRETVLYGICAIKQVEDILIRQKQRIHPFPHTLKYTAVGNCSKRTLAKLHFPQWTHWIDNQNISVIRCPLQYSAKACKSSSGTALCSSHPAYAASYTT